MVNLGYSGHLYIFTLLKHLMMLLKYIFCSGLHFYTLPNTSTLTMQLRFFLSEKLLNIRVILITQNRDIKTRDVAHCLSSLLRKLAMLASDDKIAMLREELRMPRLLVQPFPACYSVRAK